MGALSNAAHAALLNYLFQGGYTATVKVRLCTTAPTQSANGTEVTTTNWTNYGRLSITADGTSFPNATVANPSVMSNGTLWDFGTATGGAGTLETLQGGELWNADDTVRIGWFTLNGVIVQAANEIKFAIGAVDITAAPAA